MTDRERFEAWAEHLMLDRQGDHYVSHYTNHAFRAWQASRHKTLEDAAYVSEQKFRRAADGNEIAEAIRSLANPEGEQG